MLQEANLQEALTEPTPVPRFRLLPWEAPSPKFEKNGELWLMVNQGNGFIDKGVVVALNNDRQYVAVDSQGLMELWHGVPAANSFLSGWHLRTLLGYRKSWITG